MSKKQRKSVKVKKVVLPASGVVRVIVPPGVEPVVMAGPRAIEIAPVRKTAKQSWLNYLFGK